MPCSSDFQCSAVAPGTICKLNQCWKADSHTAAPSLPTWPSFPSTPSLPSFPSQQPGKLGYPNYPLGSPCASCNMLLTYEVCGADGNTYRNDCEASCHNVMVSHQGSCHSHVTPIVPSRPSMQPSTQNCERCLSLPYDPVCANDDRSYFNECEVDCVLAGQGWYITKRGPC